MPTILFRIRRSEYPTAPSMQISCISPGLRLNRLGRVPFEKSNSGMSRSGSIWLSRVRIAFALRGAPCGDDSRPGAVGRDYHDEQTTGCRPADDLHSLLQVRMFDVRLVRRQRTEYSFVGLLEADSVRSNVVSCLGLVPVAPRHRETLAIGPYLGLMPC